MPQQLTAAEQLPVAEQLFVEQPTFGPANGGPALPMPEQGLQPRR